MTLYIVILICMVIFSIALNVFLYLALRNNLIKIQKYEEWVLSVLDELQKTYLRLKEVDDRQIFEKDDDVGFTFSSILNIIDELNKKIR